MALADSAQCVSLTSNVAELIAYTINVAYNLQWGRFSPCLLRRLSLAMLVFCHACLKSASLQLMLTLALLVFQAISFSTWPIYKQMKIA